jgi:soluble epoxide hydrolase/lipid-phosphate phosphatase
LFFPANNTVWKQHFAPVGAARAWLNSNTTTPLPSYVSEEDKAAWVRRYSQPGAMAASLNYYKALLRGIQEADEAALTDEDRKLKVPVLAVGGLQDPIVTPNRVSTAIEHYAAAGYQVEMLDTGHWMMLEQKENVSRILIDFVRGEK